MKTNSINSNAKPAFKARLACSQGAMRSFMKTRSDIYSKDLVLKIADAFKKHPSDVIVRPYIVSKPTLYGTRGIVSSRFTTYKDVEPVQNDGKAPLKNVLRRILDPDNKDCFNKLVGDTKDKYYDSWWNNNIAPIWDEINENFRSKVFFHGNHDKDFNQDFQDRKERTWYRLLNE